LNISDRIRQLRTSNHLNQKAFGISLGVKENNVTQWETGNNNPSLDILRKMCEIYKVTADWLLFGIEPEIKNDSPGGEPLKEISNTLKELAGSVRNIEANLMIAAGGMQHKKPQSQPTDIPGKEHIPEPERTEAEGKVDSQTKDTAERFRAKKKYGAKGRQDSSKENS
jgi:transcriptional regulator with XRE-family HTH domain